MKIDTSKWKEFYIKDLFEITNCIPHDIGNLEDGNVPFVGRTEKNNGLQGFVDVPDEDVNDGGCISLSRVATNVALWQPEKFTASQHITSLRNNRMSVLSGLFVCTVMNEYMKERFSYGRTIGQKDISDFVIKLPATASGDPDWDFMEEYMGGLHSKPLTTSNKPSNTPLNTSEWGEFRIGDIFKIKNGKGLTTEEIENNPGDIPCIQGGEAANGSIGKIDKTYCITPGYVIMEERCLTVARVGTAGCVNYWDGECAIGDKCKALVYKTKNRNIYHYLFAQAVINNLRYKYSYGRGLVTEKYSDETIKLPITPSGDPDWNFMEDYIKSLPYGDKI